MFLLQVGRVGYQTCLGCRPTIMILCRSAPVIQLAKRPSVAFVNNYIKHIFFIPTRTLIQKPKASTLSPKFKKDGVSTAYEFIYRNNSTNYVVYGLPIVIGMFSVITVIMGKIVVDHHIYGKKCESVSVSETYGSVDPLTFSYCVLSTMPIMAFYMYRATKTVVLRMYYNPVSKEFIGILLRFGIVKQKLRFTANDIQYHGVSGIRGNVSIKGKRCLIIEQDFTQTLHYNRFMRFDEHRDSDYHRERENEHVYTYFRKGFEREKNKISKRFEDKFQEKRIKKREGKD